MQSTCDSKYTSAKPLHVAIIMDGNGRWALNKGLPREAGHHAGVATLRKVVEAAPHLGITTLTVYAFSVDNWTRPAGEVSVLMSIFKRYLETEVSRLVRSGVALTVIGRRDRLSNGLVTLIGEAEAASAAGRQLSLRIAIDYSGRESILAAVAAALACQPGPLTRDQLSQLLAEKPGAPDVDLLIRTSGEQRLSDFLLWESAYAELLFTSQLWPDFTAADLEAALSDYRSRDRRFGGLTPPQPVSLMTTNPCISAWGSKP
ncbi:MAG: di-trans,poly-cis-decaprenylcistransferase [Hyphomicrobiaceae bacterium]